MNHSGVFFGLTTLDIIYYLPHHPAANEKVKAERQLSLAGGPAANAAVSFAAFDNEASLITGLGTHPLTQEVKTDLATHKVHLIDRINRPEQTPVISSILVNLNSGERSVVYSNTNTRRLKPEAVGELQIDQADILLLDGYFLLDAVQLAEQAKNLKIPIVLDGGSWKNGLENLLPFVDYAVCSDDFHPPGCKDKQAVFNNLLGYGIQNIAITRGGESILASVGGPIKELPVMQVQTLDTLAAGDILHGAFCHYILHHDFFSSLSRASEVASLACSSLGTRAWIEQETFK